MRGETSELNDLAQFLRDQITEADLRLDQLVPAVGLAVPTISQRLSGKNLDRDFVAAVITACTDSPALAGTRDKQMELALRLWQKSTTSRTRLPQLPAAQTVESVRGLAVESGALAVERGRVIEAYAENLELYRQMRAIQEQLDLVSSSALKARAAEQDAMKLTMVLSVCVWRLSGELERLKVVRESAITAVPVDPVHIQAIDSHLASVEMRQVRSRRDLDQANNKRERAFQVLTEAIGRRQMLTENIRQLAEVLEGGAVSTSATELVGRTQEWPVEFALDEVDLILDRLEQSAQDLTDQIEDAAVDLEAATQAARPLTTSPETANLSLPPVTLELTGAPTTKTLSGTAKLLNTLWEIGEYEQAKVLAGRATTSATLDDPAGAAQLLETLLKLGEFEQARVLARRIATSAPLDDLFGAAQLLNTLRKIGEHGQVKVLAGRAATWATLDNLFGAAQLLDTLLKLGEFEQAKVLAGRATTSATLDNPIEVARLLNTLREIGEFEQAKVLAGRAATSVALDDPIGTALLLDVLWEIGAFEHAKVLAGRAAAWGTLGDSAAVARLLNTLREIGAFEHAKVLAGRAAMSVTT